MMTWRFFGFGHPSARKLAQWVDGEPVPIEQHLATCSRCADRLEAMAGPGDDSVRQALLRLLQVPDQLAQTMRAGIEDHERNQRDRALLGELFGLPFRTAQLMMTNDQGDE